MKPLILITIGVLIGLAMAPVPAILSEPYAITVQTITSELLAACQDDSNCIDINSL